MKRYITTTILGLVAVGATALADALPTTVAELQSKMTDAQKAQVIANNIYTDAALYAAVKNAGWVFDGVTLPPRMIAHAQFFQKDYADINELVAAQAIGTAYYKIWVAARVAALGSETIAAYDWLQVQRLKTIEAAVQTSGKKSEFLADLAAQVLAAAKAKQQ